MGWNLNAALQSTSLVFPYSFAVCGLLPPSLHSFCFALRENCVEQHIKPMAVFFFAEGEERKYFFEVFSFRSSHEDFLFWQKM